MAHEFSIEGRPIGQGHPAFIIAEAGVIHNGSLVLARQFIEFAAACGADCFKFQTFKDDRIAMADAPNAAYQLEVTDAQESQINMLRSIELPDEHYPKLI